MTPHTCPHCRHTIEDDEALLCLFCGESLGRSVGVMGALRHPRSKWIFISVIVLIILSFFLLLASAEDKVISGEPPAGEELSYSVKWLGLPVGSVTTLSKGTAVFHGRKIYVFEAHVRIGGLVAVFFGTDIHFVSYVDTGGGAVRTIESRRGHGDKDIVTEFDAGRKKAVVKDLRHKTEEVFDVSSRVRDILGACFFLRLAPFREGDRIAYDVFHRNEMRHYIFWVSGKSQKEFRAHPYAWESKGKLLPGRVDAFFADDAVRTPLRAVIRGPVFGSVTLSLVKPREVSK